MKKIFLKKKKNISKYKKKKIFYTKVKNFNGKKNFKLFVIT